MKIAVFSTKSYDRQSLPAANERHGHDLRFFEASLNADTAKLAAGCEAVCIFVNDKADAATIGALAKLGIKVIALRCAGFNNVDLEAANQLGVTVVRVPAYSPHAVAEHTLGLVLTLNRQIHRAYNRVREHNFDLQGLLGFDLYGKTVGVIGTGKIGVEVVKLFAGFGCRVVAFDVQENPQALEAGATYVSLDEIYRSSRIISLHCPLTPDTFHLINAEAISKMSPGVMLINTSRGAVIDTKAVLAALKAGHLGALAIDVYEEEEGLFFEDGSGRILQDDLLARLLTFPNVLVTGHQAFFTEEALANIAETTLTNLDDVASGRPCPNVVTPPG